VVGEFKRGKSTLINALLGADVVPTGVLPLTAVATEIGFGDPGAVVEHLDGTRRPITIGEVADFVTEERNSGNERGVARVEVRGRWPLLEPGVTLVDTPGIGSVHRHNTEAARAALLDADGALVVLSADTPMSEQERDLLLMLADRRAPTFFVLNKADHLRGGELDQVRRFVEQVLYDTLGRKTRVFAVSARAAFRAKGSDGDPGEFGLLVAELERFIADDLVGARLVTARAELARLGRSLGDALAIEQAALDHDAAEMVRLVSLFAAEGARQRQAFDDDRTLLDRDVSRLGDDLAGRLAAFARAAPAEHTGRLAEAAAAAPRRRLADELRGAVEAAVRDGFEGFRRVEAERTERVWRSLADGFRDQTQERVDAVRRAAADLFAVPLPAVLVPAVAEQRERFFYLFIHVEGFNEPFGRALGRLVPSGLARRRALARARADLAREFDKHAGRARWDLTQRLDGVRRAFEAAMRAELDATIDAIVGAARRAEDLGRAAEGEQRRYAADAARQRSLAEHLAGWAERPE